MAQVIIEYVAELAVKLAVKLAAERAVELVVELVAEQRHQILLLQSSCDFARKCANKIYNKIF